MSLVPRGIGRKMVKWLNMFATQVSNREHCTKQDS